MLRAIAPDVADGASRVARNPRTARLATSKITVIQGRPIGSRLMSSTTMRSIGVWSACAIPSARRVRGISLGMRSCDSRCRVDLSPRFQIRKATVLRATGLIPADLANRLTSSTARPTGRGSGLAFQRSTASATMDSRSRSSLWLPGFGPGRRGRNANGDGSIR
jgi:hypothetical protein